VTRAEAGADAGAGTIRVMLVDDQAVVRAGFRVLLEQVADIEVVAEASSGSSAVTTARRLRPDVVCMDVRMPGGDGLTATRQILADAAGSPPAVLVVTTFDLDEYVFGALEAGASGFILKDCEPEDLIDAIRRLAAGYGLVDQTVTRRVIAEFARRRPAAPPESAAAHQSRTASASISTRTSGAYSTSTPISDDGGNGCGIASSSATRATPAIRSSICSGVQSVT